MGRKKFIPYTISNFEITAAGSEGMALGRYDDKVIFVEQGVPGDIVNIRVYRDKKSFCLATIQEIIKPSADRVETFCSHFGICGGCKSQQIAYTAQLRFKQQQVHDAFERIGKFPFPEILHIIGSKQTTYYRNKCEYNFIDRKWVENKTDLETLSPTELKGLGYHMPGRFDKIFDVEHCYLQPTLANEIRNALRDFCKENNFEFFNPYSQEGYMRNVIFRNTDAGEWMVILIFRKENKEHRELILDFLLQKFPAIKALLYAINTKLNDTIYDLEIIPYKSNDHIIEWLEDLQFKIGPKSFFQTNTKQTLSLYSKTREFAGLTGNETVYDLYTGVGSIALFVSKFAKKVIGIESVESAIHDAKINMELNNISNIQFYAGDMKAVLTDEFMNEHGSADVIITDPPRAGMHYDVVQTILRAKAKKVVYVSCNPATQARDIALMEKDYTVTKVQPVDMFPHTHHIENIVLLELKQNG